MDWIERDKNVIWHPYSQMKTIDDPIAIVKGEGSYLIDEEGNKYLDAISSWWVNLHGHSQKDIVERIHQQMLELEHVIFAGFTHPSAIELAEKLLAVVKLNQSKVFYSDNGSTAVEIAVKMAIQYFLNQGIQKTKIIAFEEAFHGETFGAMAVSGPSVFNDHFRKLCFEVIHIPLPQKGDEEKSFEAMKKAIEPGDVAAFIYEPLVQGAAGMRMYEPEALKKLMQMAKSADVLCIADEVAVGFGRTGYLFASHSVDISPDLMCFSKALTAGFLPLSITSCSEKIYQAFYDDDKLKTFYHGHSFTANPIGCAAALASLDLLLKAENLDKIQWLSKSHSDFVQEIKDHPCIENARSTGTLFAFDVKTDSKGYLSSIRDDLYRFFMERGILLRPLGNVIYIFPPLSFNPKQLDRVYSAIREALLWLEAKQNDEN
tara:strand:- start:763 stop:2055 length:1293 start_codon:yes stop_codon:yes gene_type:complete